MTVYRALGSLIFHKIHFRSFSLSPLDLGMWPCVFSPYQFSKYSSLVTLTFSRRRGREMVSGPLLCQSHGSSPLLHPNYLTLLMLEKLRCYSGTAKRSPFTLVGPSLRNSLWFVDPSVKTMSCVVFTSLSSKILKPRVSVHSLYLITGPQSNPQWLLDVCYLRFCVLVCTGRFARSSYKAHGLHDPYNSLPFPLRP
jgi:hypothetical protein